MKFSECGLTDEIFSFVSESTGQEFHWNTTKVQEALAAGTIEPVAHMYLDITDADYLHISLHNGIEEDHLINISPERLKIPVIFVEFPPDEHDPDPSHVLIDGNHRLVKTYREGKRRIGAVIFDVETLKPFLVEDIPAVVSASMLKALGATTSGLMFRFCAE